MSRLLVVDFGFFFRNDADAGTVDGDTAPLWDWGRNESPLYVSNNLWVSRAAAFLTQGGDLPQATAPARGWDSFWDRFTFTRDALCFYGDSNRHAGRLSRPHQQPFDEVLLFDSHHDCGGRGTRSLTDFTHTGRYGTDDWMLTHHLRGSRLRMRYPLWKPHGPNERIPDGVTVERSVDDGVPVEGPVSVVYICRSGAWVPPWTDPQFLAFLAACPLETVQVDDQSMDRQFPMSAALHLAEQMKPGSTAHLHPQAPAPGGTLPPDPIST